MIDKERLRAWWWYGQALNGRSLGFEPDELLATTGWARSVGGANPYLTLFSRGRTSREEVDSAVEAMIIHELPSARGCTYVVPAVDYALALKVGQPFNGTEIKKARKLGVTDNELGDLCSAVLSILDAKPLDPKALRKALGDAVRNLGDEGKKQGITTTLPVALGWLQAHGEIRRIPTSGRLDQQRYRYARWRPNPLNRLSLPITEAYTQLARRYFRWAAPATLGEFRWFSGLGVRASKHAIDTLGLVPLNDDDSRLLFPDQKEALADFRPPEDPDYQLISSLDALFLLRRDVTNLVAENDLMQEVLVGNTRRALGGLTDLPHHAIADRGQLVGLWGYDVETESIVWVLFRRQAGGMDSAMIDAITDTEAYIREQLGDARAFSLDSPKRRAPRIEALRRYNQ